MDNEQKMQAIETLLKELEKGERSAKENCWINVSEVEKILSDNQLNSVHSI